MDGSCPAYDAVMRTSKHQSVTQLIAACAISAAALSALGPGTARAAELVIVITNIKQVSGLVRLGLYNDPKRFPKRSGTIAGGKVKVKRNTARFVFRNLKPGVYAVAIYHDANANNRFDKSLGIPLEGFAFSNNARPRLSAPSFKRAAVTVQAPRTQISIRLLHW